MKPDDEGTLTDDRAIELAREAIDREGYDVGSVSDVYRTTGSVVVPATTVDGTRVNVHVDSDTEEVHVATIEDG